MIPDRTFRLLEKMEKSLENRGDLVVFASPGFFQVQFIDEPFEEEKEESDEEMSHDESDEEETEQTDSD